MQGVACAAAHVVAGPLRLAGFASAEDRGPHTSATVDAEDDHTGLVRRHLGVLARRPGLHLDTAAHGVLHQLHGHQESHQPAACAGDGHPHEALLDWNLHRDARRPAARPIELGALPHLALGQDDPRCPSLRRHEVAGPTLRGGVLAVPVVGRQGRQVRLLAWKRLQVHGAGFGRAGRLRGLRQQEHFHDLGLVAPAAADPRRVRQQCLGPLRADAGHHREVRRGARFGRAYEAGRHIQRGHLRWQPRQRVRHAQEGLRLDAAAGGELVCEGVYEAWQDALLCAAGGLPHGLGHLLRDGGGRDPALAPGAVLALGQPSLLRGDVGGPPATRARGVDHGLHALHVPGRAGAGPLDRLGQQVVVHRLAGTRKPHLGHDLVQPALAVVLEFGARPLLRDRRARLPGLFPRLAVLGVVLPRVGSQDRQECLPVPKRRGSHDDGARAGHHPRQRLHR
mmetsp:Transcript_129011/g.412495  ORF Transcript_129011/g.412495 Transcript_129011/m.412495 type:complete len:452 (-) Transcript_129011:402-1757(-)